MEFKINDLVICEEHPTLGKPSPASNVHIGHMYIIKGIYTSAVDPKDNVLEVVPILKPQSVTLGRWVTTRFKKVEPSNISKLERIIYGVEDI